MQSRKIRSIAVLGVTTVPAFASQITIALRQKRYALTLTVTVCDICVSDLVEACLADDSGICTAYDDQTSTFIVPEGGGFGVVFCPLGRSSNILATLGAELRQIASQGKVTPQQMLLLQNATYIQDTSAQSGMDKVAIDWLILVSVLVGLTILREML